MSDEEMTSTMSDHLEPDVSNRGFDHYPPIESTYGDTVRVYESSAADGPHVWLSINDATAHLTAADAWKVAEQVMHLVRNHYQGDASPETNDQRRFYLQRDHDVTGASGTGRVADGVLWPDGTVSVRWRGERVSIVHWDRIGDAEAVHGHGGATQIVWIDR